ncbi:TPA: LCP family protein [Streptococcus suis]|nr:LCP family protein [Streptococcus suis]
MTRNSGNLNHHEELRLDYLRKNIHYLNDKEKRELEFLEYKSGSISNVVDFAHTSDGPEHSYFENEIDQVEEENLLLPPYPKENRRRKKQRQQTAKTSSVLKVKPKKPKKRFRTVKRIFWMLLIAILLFVGSLGFMFYKGYSSISDHPQSELFNGEASSDGVNILILGTDGRVGETSDMTRTDSIMVLNVNNSDNKVKMVSFMRDTLIDIDGYDYKLNTAYTFGEQNNGRGAENVRQVLKENFDIDIQYYAMIDFSTFATAIDTLFPNGVTIDAQFSTIDGIPVSSVEVPDDLNMENGIVPNQTISVGQQQMDGRTLLNYARFRKDDEGDYGRTKRQQQVMAAIFAQIKDPTKLFTGSEAAGKVYALTSTNVPGSFLITKGIFIAMDGANGVERTTVPENGDWIDEYDVYGGSGLKIDFEKYKQRLAELGLR